MLEQAQATADDASGTAPPEAAYAQLVSQPEAYRGQPVRVRGTVVRESVKRVAENDLGLTEYHQLVIAPRGGGEWPIVVYALELPQGLPRGDGLREPVTVDGLFFKVWSFAHDDGAGLAPVIVAQAIDWQPPKDAPRESNTIAPGSLWPGLVVAAAFAAGVVAWVSWQTRRPKQSAETEASDAARDALSPTRRRGGRAMTFAARLPPRAAAILGAAALIAAAAPPPPRSNRAAFLRCSPTPALTWRSSPRLPRPAAN